MSTRPGTAWGQRAPTRSHTAAGRSPAPGTARASRGAAEHRHGPPQPLGSRRHHPGVTDSHHAPPPHCRGQLLEREHHCRSSRPLAAMGSGCHSNRRFILGTGSLCRCRRQSRGLCGSWGAGSSGWPLWDAARPPGVTRPARTPARPWGDGDTGVTYGSGDALGASPQAALVKDAAGRDPRGTWQRSPPSPACPRPCKAQADPGSAGGSGSSRSRCRLGGGWERGPRLAPSPGTTPPPRRSPGAPAPAASPARHRTRGSPWGRQEPAGLTHGVAVPGHLPFCLESSAPFSCFV